MTRKLFIVALSALLAGCTSLDYYAQVIGGHLKVMNAARPIDEIVHDPATDPGLKARLMNARAIREFASRELALPDNKSYRTYADLGRPYVLWNVFAAPEFSVEPERWCMVFVGCVSYRGYYDRGEAEHFAGELRNSGLDTYVVGIPAYSTLGYFNDPVLNTFLRLGDTEAANIIFHELAHQLVYAAGDTAFNESFATMVASEGLRRWFARNGNAEQQLAFNVQQQHRMQFARLVEEYRGKLATLYAMRQSPEEMRRSKAEIISDMKHAYAEMKVTWGGDTRYDKWFEQGLNNAKMASVGLYTQLVPAFQALLDKEGGDLPRFYKRVAELARLSQAGRLVALNGYLESKPAANSSKAE